MNGGNMTQGSNAALYAAAAVLRLVLFTGFPGLSELLTGRVEISTPVTSFKRCKTLWVYSRVVQN
jgi:GPI-anchor transamidase subunit U